MDLLGKICKELGVKVGQRWFANDGFEYIICEDGRVVWLQPGWGWKRLETYEDILTGKLKPVWTPKEGETVWTVDLGSKDKISFRQWYRLYPEKYYKMLLERGLIFKTKEEATEALKHLEIALMYLNKRTEDRIERKVLGTYED